MAELFDDFHKLKGFTQTQQDLKDDDALRLELHNTPVLLTIDVEEPKCDMVNVKVVPEGPKVLFRPHLL